ncbi:hypothetical protein B1222_06850 [Paenibacillus larvae subsp. pulvifaciens]|nr:3-oxoacyl-[acyl-carrier-protein] synthase III C-terminal domain-containing protein [Paenibacillus larvae]AQT84172.1 hypothetical protein B1222_06850 [Paenibacillus larvae subsp. pulvifaciens]MCY7521006.1 hypothetical protein [Paenibacillus larvae]MCY9500891.1 hypothetical protein [Paenibacillus larvae]MCY9680870.1 hypothetical protein [Paenibacillus larvae]MCY9747728.1 hypothetical protein [Paenibacillus larvae]
MDDYHLMEFHTSDEWIVQRTGIRERRITTETEFTSHLCIRAVENLLESYGGSLEDVDLILVATHTPDVPFPSVASLVQKHFDVRHTGALDVNATCAGFTYALHMANSLITAGLHNKILVIGAEIPVEHTLYNLEYFGNTSAASIPLALHIGIKEGKVKKGDRILLYGFGGGYVHGGIIFTW